MDQKWPTVSELEMLDLLWFNVEEGIQMFRETGMLESFMTYSPTLGRVLKPYLLPIL